MTALDWTIVAILALASVVTITQVGKPRQPITPGSAAISALINVGLIIWIILT